MKNKKNILFISYDGMTDPLGQSQVIPYLVGLTRYNYHFTILSCEKPQRLKLNGEYVEGLLEQYPIKWVPILYHKNPPVFSSVYDVMVLHRTARRLHAKRNFDMVHTRAGVPALVGLCMKKNLGIKFLHDIREFYADSRVDGGMWDTSNFFYRRIYNFFKRKEEEEIKNCDGIVCLTHAAKKIISQWPEYKKNIPLEVIPCSVDLQLFDTEKISWQTKDNLKRDLGIGDTDFVVSYLGSIGGWYLTDEMMKCCKKIADVIPSSKFLFITPHQPEIIFGIANFFGIPQKNIIVTHAQRHDVPLYLSLSKYSIFFIKPCYSKKSSSPTKHGEIMAMGIPVITNSGVGDVADIVEKYHSGIVLDELNEKQFLLAATTVAKQISSHNYSAYSVAIRDSAKEYYDLDNAVAKYKKIYDSILNSES